MPRMTAQSAASRPPRPRCTPSAGPRWSCSGRRTHRRWRCPAPRRPRRGRAGGRGAPGTRAKRRRPCCARPTTSSSRTPTTPSTPTWTRTTRPWPGCWPAVGCGCPPWSASASTATAWCSSPSCPRAARRRGPRPRRPAAARARPGGSWPSLGGSSSEPAGGHRSWVGRGGVRSMTYC